MKNCTVVATVLKPGDNSNEIRYVGLNHVNMNSMDPFGLPVPGTRYQYLVCKNGAPPLHRCNKYCYDIALSPPPFDPSLALLLAYIWLLILYIPVSWFAEYHTLCLACPRRQEQIVYRYTVMIPFGVFCDSLQSEILTTNRRHCCCAT